MSLTLHFIMAEQRTLMTSSKKPRSSSLLTGEYARTTISPFTLRRAESASQRPVSAEARSVNAWGLCHAHDGTHL